MLSPCRLSLFFLPHFLHWSRFGCLFFVPWRYKVYFKVLDFQPPKPWQTVNFPIIYNKVNTLCRNDSTKTCTRHYQCIISLLAYFRSFHTYVCPQLLEHLTAPVFTVLNDFIFLAQGEWYTHTHTHKIK